MMRFYLMLMFSVLSAAGLGLILYATVGSRKKPQPINGECLALAFGDAADEGLGALDFDLGHEGLTHREKETFNPNRHKPELIDTRKKSS